MATSGGGTVLWICGRVLRTGPRPPGRVDSPWTTRQARVAHRLPTLAGLSPTTPQDRQPIFSQVVFTTGTHAFDPDQPIGSKSPKSLLTSEASRPIIPSSRKRHPTSTSIANRSISPSLSHWTTGPLKGLVAKAPSGKLSSKAQFRPRQIQEKYSKNNILTKSISVRPQSPTPCSPRFVIRARQRRFDGDSRGSGVVPGAGLEPAWPCGRGILSPLCLPVSPPGRARPGAQGEIRTRTPLRALEPKSSLSANSNTWAGVSYRCAFYSSTRRLAANLRPPP